MGKTHRSDIAHQFADLPKLRAAAPKINFIAQEANRNSTEINVVEETQIMPTSNHEILNADLVTVKH